jgi:hypothetical protein
VSRIKKEKKGTCAVLTPPEEKGLQKKKQICEKEKNKEMYMVSTISGKEDYGDYRDGGVKDALFSFPQGICLDNQKNMYIADNSNCCIHKITPNGKVTTLVSNYNQEK